MDTPEILEEKAPEVTWYAATGRRKTATARVRLRPGGGKMTVNGKLLEEYFKNQLALINDILLPFRLTGTLGKFDLFVRVDGGGLSGQAGAIRHGIARALVLYNPELRPTLKAAGLLTRDPRMKERKKYGLRKARRAPQWRKR